MTYVKVNGTEYEALISGLVADKAWDGRASKTVTLEMTYAEAMQTFTDGVTWSIIAESEIPVYDEQTEQETAQTVRTEFDNSDYCMAGDVTDHRDGTISVKMGRMTDLEELIEEIYGGEE